SIKASIDELESQLEQKGFKVASLHGDKGQASRMEILHKFKAGTYHALIATDVVAPGLDIKSIKSVVNFDIAKDMDMRVHRIGCCLIAAVQNVSVELMDHAMKDGRFRSKRDAREGGGGNNGKGRGGRGVGGRGVRGVESGI
ncbi:hypothetical protein SOVF_001300, partial [Spinacia oleracea]